MADEKVLLTVPQAADRLGVGRSFMYAMVMAGKVDSIKLGRARRVPAVALERFVQEQLEAKHADA